MTFQELRDQRVKELQAYLFSYNDHLHTIREKLALKTADTRAVRDELMLASDAAIEFAKMAMGTDAQLSRQFYALALEMMNLSLETIRDQHAPRLEDFAIPGASDTSGNARL